jgi:hypothetical protein
MTFSSLLRIALVGGSLFACVSQYTSPGGEVENTGTKDPSDATQPASEATSPPDEAKAEPSEAREPANESKRAPTDASGACDDRTCVSTSDCCGGYQCGFDPERSKVMRYCLSQ